MKIQRDNLEEILSQFNLLNTTCRLRKFIEGTFIFIEVKGNIINFKDKNNNVYDIYEDKNVKVPIPNGFFRDLFCLPPKTRTVVESRLKQDKISQSLNGYASIIKPSKIDYIECNLFTECCHPTRYVLETFKNEMIEFNQNTPLKYILNEKMFRLNSTLLKEIDKHLKKEEKIVVQTKQYYIIVKK